MTSDELNRAIAELCNDEQYKVRGLEDTGKCIPYIGWYWRYVDFDDYPYMFGIIPGEFKGFMENNKWGYDYAIPTEEQSRHIRALLEKAVQNPSNETLQAVFDAIQQVGERT